MMIKNNLGVAILSCLFASSAGWAADSAGEPGRSSGKANPMKNVYFGEQHLHTTNSPDAFVIGVRQTCVKGVRALL
jgi:hypothetical protein